MPLRPDPRVSSPSFYPSEIPASNFSRRPEGADGVRFRNVFSEIEALLPNSEQHFQEWIEAVVLAFLSVVDALPKEACEQAEDSEAFALNVSVADLIADPAEVMTAIYVRMSQQSGRFFNDVLVDFRRNQLRAAGIDDPRRSTRKVLLPHEQKGVAPAELARLYFSGTPFASVLRCDVPFVMPKSARYTHQMVTGGSGHGKSQLLQQFLLPDLAEVGRGEASVLVIDSQGDMLNTITHLAEFDPEHADSLADRLVLIDPNDIEAPPCLNLFDVGLERLDTYNALEREKLMNGAIALYEYMFGALLGATLTQRQGVIFKYLARLLMVVPEANIHTLRHFMEDPEATKHHLADLEGSARAFFETQFLSSSFDDTRQQILTRLWGVLSNPVLERMFVNRKNKVNMFDALNSGKIVLINAAKDLLKQDGCEMLGRFFIDLIVQAIQERAAIPQQQRPNTWIYIDEVQDYFSEGDTQLEVLFSQARKYKAGITIANQTLAQLPRDLLYSVLASTSTKLAGGTSARDATTLAKEMRCEPEFLQDMRKREKQTEFACHIKNVTERPLRLTVPFGQMERRPRLSREAHDALLAINRSRYCATGDDQATATPTPSKASVTDFDLGEYEPL